MFAGLWKVAIFKKTLADGITLSGTNDRWGAHRKRSPNA
jgi:hypothetical protein